MSGTATTTSAWPKPRRAPIAIASTGGVWMALAYGFGGLRDFHGELHFDPRLPQPWDRLAFNLRFHDRQVTVDLTHERFAFTGDRERYDDLQNADLARVMAVNFTGVFLTMQEGIRVLRAQGLGGNIVINSSKNVFGPGKDFGAYSASKAAGHQLGKVSAIESRSGRM